MPRLPFGRLIEQHVRRRRIADRDDTDLVGFDLEAQFDRPLQRILQRDHALTRSGPSGCSGSI